MNVCGVLQARYNSKRLRGKVCMDLNGLPVLWHAYRRLMHCTTLDSLVVAIGAENYQPVEDLCARYGMMYMVGPEDDLITRLREAAYAEHAHAIARVTADEPLIDPSIVDQVVQDFVQAWPKYEFACNWSPRTWPDGQDVDVISMNLLARLDGIETVNRETYVLDVVRDLKHLHVGMCYDYSYHNLCLDTAEDHAKLSKILAKIGNDNWNWDAAVSAMEER